MILFVCGSPTFFFLEMTGHVKIDKGDFLITDMHGGGGHIPIDAVSFALGFKPNNLDVYLEQGGFVTFLTTSENSAYVSAEYINDIKRGERERSKTGS